MCAEVQSDDDETYYSAEEVASRDASPLERWALPPPPHTLPLPMVPTRPPPSAMCVAAPPAATPPRPEAPTPYNQTAGYAIDVEKTMKIRAIIARMPVSAQPHNRRHELVEVRVNPEHDAYHPLQESAASIVRGYKLTTNTCDAGPHAASSQLRADAPPFYPSFQPCC